MCRGKIGRTKGLTMANLITIDQLLESVDLDFEPRWVTKDKTGDICLYSEKPRLFITGTIWQAVNNTCHCCTIGRFKIAEFEGKDWTECIYEVPRKTTGKIEKMLEQKLTIGKTKYEYPTHAMLMDKINELVDAVNELKENKGV